MAERNRIYGNPLQNFIDMARLWSVILGIEVTPSQVSLCLICLKLSRLKNTPQHADSWVDIAGYAACGAEVSESSTSQFGGSVDDDSRPRTSREPHGDYRLSRNGGTVPIA